MKSIALASLSTAVLITGCSEPESPATATETPTATESMDAMAQPARTATTKGRITAIDSAAGKITIAHEPVPAVQWPAMTMAFKATPEQLAALQVGQAVQFEFQTRGMDATINSISAAD